MTGQSRGFLSDIYFQWPRIAKDLYLHGGGDCSITRLRKIEQESERYRKEFHDQWLCYGLHAMVCPPYPVVAGPLGSLTNSSGTK